VANPRRANGHRRDQVRARVLREESDCWLCGKPVDKTLPHGLPGSPEVDEIVPVSLGGSPIDRANCRLAHRLCNVRRGNGTRKAKVKIEPLTTSRRWGETP
jgi:5-methylcytosine-specific restriction endonuclease McrA